MPGGRFPRAGTSTARTRSELARALIVGCGCRGRALGGELIGAGWQVRGTSRHQARLGEIGACGIEGAIADPNQPGTILDLAADVAVIVWLLGSALGAPEMIAAIHGPRLERLLERLVDTPVRGFAYEAVGRVPPRHLSSGREIVRAAEQRWQIPTAIIDADPRDPGWAEISAGAVSSLLSR